MSQTGIEDILLQLPAVASLGFLAEVGQLKEQSISASQTDSGAIIDSLFLTAIKEHYEPSGNISEHIYLKQFEIPQIRLFDIIINKFPFVSAAHKICNAIIVEQIGDIAHPVILDIGIGRGVQMISLLKELAKNKHVRQLTMIGVEPFADALEHARESLEQAAALMPFKVTLHFINDFAEQVRPETLRLLLPQQYDKIFVNCSLAVHHISTIELRRHFFHTLQQLDVDAVLLTEPNSDHLNADWATRTRNAWKHFSAVFDTVDQLEISQEDKAGVKMFFGREIMDIVSAPEESRFEKHEPADRWVAYGREIGMTVNTELQIPSYANQLVSVCQEENGLMIKRNNTDILAIIPLTRLKN